MAQQKSGAGTGRGFPANEAGAPLVGVSPPDSQAYAAFRAAISQALVEPAPDDADHPDHADTAARRARRRTELTGLIQAMPDAGERADAGRRLTEYDTVVARLDAERDRAGAVSGGAAVDRAYDIRHRVEQVVDDPTRSTGERIAACRDALAELGDLAARADRDSRVGFQVREQAGIVERIADAIDHATDHARTRGTDSRNDGDEPGHGPTTRHGAT